MLKIFKGIFLFWGLSLLGALLSLQLQASVNNLSLSKLSVEDGLSQGTVNSIVQDSSGFMWLGTESGLNIYDGYSFKTLKGPEGDFDTFEVRIVMQDSEGLLWINVFDKGIYTYNSKNNDYKLILSQSLLEKNNYVTSVEESNNVFWITTSKKLFKYEKRDSKVEVELDLSIELAIDHIINQVKAKDEYLFLATDVGIFVYHTVKKTWNKLPYNKSNGHAATALQESKIYKLHINENNLYIGTHVNVLVLDITHLSSFFDSNNELPAYQKLAEGLSIWQFYIDNDQLYVTSHHGLSVIDLTEKKLRHLFGFTEEFDYVSDNVIRSIVKDRNGTFWLGTNSTGVYLWDPSTELVINYRYKKNSVKSLSYNEVWNILPHHNNVDLFWVATGNGLNLINDKNQTIESFIVATDRKDLYSESHIFQMQYYDESTLLLATYDGMKVFDVNKREIITSPYSDEINKEFAQDIVGFFIDDKKDLWLASAQSIYNISLVEQSISKVFEPLLDSVYKEIKQDITNFLGMLPNSNLLLFSNNDSLWGFDTELKQAKLLYRHPRANISEWAYIDNWVVDNNTLWLSFVGKGLIGLSLPDFEPKYHYSKKNAPIDNNIYSLQIDADGDLWFSTHNGLFMMDREDHHFRNFGLKSGLVNKEFNGGAASTLANNKFAYGGMSGLSVFDPLKLKGLKSLDDFFVKVTHINVLSRELHLPLEIDTNTPIQLKYNDVGIRVDFSTLTYTKNDRIRYKYKLKGVDNVEYPLTRDNSITFPVLPSGEHILEVRAESPISGKLSQAVQIKFSVNYAPWASPFAYFTYIAFLLLIIGIWLYKRKKQQQALIDAHEEVKCRENRLQLALIGSNSEVWDWQASNNLIFAKRAVKDLQLMLFSNSYSFDEHVELIHPDDKEDFLARWKLFLKQEGNNNDFHCTYRLKSNDELWFWYKDVGNIVEFSLDGSPSRVTGTYTNITESKAAEERALYYGDAFKHTQDWVFILSENLKKVTANQALCNVFGWEHEEFDFNNEIFGFNKEQKKFYLKIISALNVGEYWRGEELITTDNNEEYYVIINITASRNENSNQIHYICVFTDITAQKLAEKELRYLANYDYLTGLPNRSLLLQRIQNAMHYSKQKQTSIALFFIDLDRFKQINDSLGHDYGDLLLKEIAIRLTSTLRAEDTVARIGGDEFVVLLEYFKGNAQLSQIAEKLITTIGEPITLNSHVVSVGASMGIALFPDDANNSDELLHNADVAMYCSKQIGRNTFQFFTERMNHEANVRLQVESNLKQGIHKQEFVNYYQPIVNSVTAVPIGLELLLRWQNNEKLVSPSVFIPIAEELGVIIEMTEKAIEKGLQHITEWRIHNKDLFLSVNISPFHFVKCSLFSFVQTQLIKYNLPPSALKLEITESALIAEPEKAIETMYLLADLGVLLALDDFGTGYSSLSYLKQLPLHIIKIDRSFVLGIGESDADEAIVDATIVLAKRLNMKCIAEGVETKEQLEYLMKRECHHIQGFLFSRPMDEANTLQYLLEHNVIGQK